MRALIVDDERLARDGLRRLLTAYPEICLAGEATDAHSAREALNALSPDLLFLDVQISGGSAFDLLASFDERPLVVFTTASGAHALRAFEVCALDYLVKPIHAERLARTIARASAAVEQRALAEGRHTDGRSFAHTTITQRLRRLVEAELCDGEPTMEYLARRLHMSGRTLHRRLAEEGTTFRRELTHVRRALAERHLRERRLTVSEIGFRLGFSEASAFHHAFKRWTGRAPEAYRRRAPIADDWRNSGGTGT